MLSGHNGAHSPSPRWSRRSSVTSQCCSGPVSSLFAAPYSEMKKSKRQNYVNNCARNVFLACSAERGTILRVQKNPQVRLGHHVHPPLPALPEGHTMMPSRCPAESRQFTSNKTNQDSLGGGKMRRGAVRSGLLCRVKVSNLKLFYLGCNYPATVSNLSVP